MELGCNLYGTGMLLGWNLDGTMMVLMELEWNCYGTVMELGWN